MTQHATNDFLASCFLVLGEATMPIGNLRRMFAPRSVAVVGASPREGSAVRLVWDQLRGFGGSKYAINPNHQAFEGGGCFASISDVPEPIDLAVVCTPAPTVASIAEQCARAGVASLVIVSTGFRESRGEGQRREAELRGVLRRYPAMRTLGPNSLGFLAPHRSLRIGLTTTSLQPGSVAFISQSESLAVSMLDWAEANQVGCSYFVSIGNVADIGFASLIDFFEADPFTESIVLYVESIHQARGFLSAARAFTKNKPILALKAGRFDASAGAAASHTGALVSLDDAYDAAFARAGVVRVAKHEDLFSGAELLSRHAPPAGNRLAILTNGGGPGVLASDYLLTCGGRLAKWSAETRRQLGAIDDGIVDVNNPLDLLSSATPERLTAALRCVLADAEVDAVLVLVCPHWRTAPQAMADAVAKLRPNASKPLLACWLGGGTMNEATGQLSTAGVPTFTTPEKAVDAVLCLDTYRRRREGLYETPRELSMPAPVAADVARRRWRDCERGSGSPVVLDEVNALGLLDDYGIKTLPASFAASAEEAVMAAERIGFPVAVKLVAPGLAHKSSVDGVQLNVLDAATVRACFARFEQRASQARSEGASYAMAGVLVQSMWTAAGGQELILGAKRDPTFGPVIMVGAGGTATEVIRDRTCELPPLNERLAWKMIDSLRIAPLLRGDGGRSPVAIERVVQTLLRLSRLLVELPELRALDINPLVATADTAIALDARVLVDAKAEPPARRYGHLAIHPFPDQWIRQRKTRSGEALLLRPIRPEDEPRWHALLAACSPETLQLRFRCMFKASTHEMATRFCYIDYDREMAIIAEVEVEGQRSMVGVAQLLCDADHQKAEVAVLVADAWQGQGIGSAVLDHVLEIAEAWRVERVVAEMALHNDRMQHMFRDRGFEVHRKISEGIATAEKRPTENQRTAEQ